VFAGPTDRMPAPIATRIIERFAIRIGLSRFGPSGDGPSGLGTPNGVGAS
jgi:hypothetical protein